MALKRNQVARLNVDSTNVSGINTKTFASPVETYARPVQTQSTPSALSQFVTALAPAVEAKATKELEVKLKREREIDNFNFKKRMQHVSNQAFITRSNQISDYNNNPEMYHQTDQAVIVEKYKKHTFDNVEQMKKEGADELQIENYKLLMETNNIELIAKINEGKKTYIKNEENKSIVNTAIAFTQTNKEITDENIKLFKEIWDDNAEAHVIYDGKTKRNKPDHKRMNKLAIKLATDLATSDPNNIVLAYLEKEGVLNTKDNIAIRSTLRDARDRSIGKVNAAQVKVDGIQKRINQAMISKQKLVKTFKKPDGSIGTFTDFELEDQLFKNEMFMTGDLIDNNKLSLYRKIMFLPPKVKDQVFNGLTYLNTGAISTPESNAAIESSYLTYIALRNSGIDLSFLSPEEQYKFEAMEFIIDKAGTSGEMTTTQDLTEEEDTVGGDARVITSKKYNQAAFNVQQMRFDVIKRPSTLIANIDNELSNSLWFDNKLKSVTNSAIVKAEIAKHAYFLMSSGNINEEDAIKKAIGIAEKDWQVVESGNETEYAFNHLNTNVDTKLVAAVIIPKYNKVLLQSNSIKKYMFETFGLVKGQYDVAIYPDEKDPNQVSIRLFEIDEDGIRSSIGSYGGKADKNTLLGDQQQLLNLIATVKTQEKFSGGTTGYTPPVMNVEKLASNTKDNNFLTEALNSISLVSTATASTLDGTEEAFVPSNQTITGENVTMEGNTIAKKTASLIATQEGFRASPYADGKDKSVGFGFYLPSLEEDEKALIKNLNNVTLDEGKAVLGLKIQKISNFLNDKIENFTNLPEKAQMAITSMGYQLGVTNIPRVWKKFTAAITEASQYAEGSLEQAQALGKAKFEMLYNVSKDGTISLNKWATQTKERAFEMANAVGEATTETVNAAASGFLNNVIPSAHASTRVPTDKMLIVGEQPSADMVADITTAINPVEAASKYLGVHERDSEGAAVVKGFFDNIVGDWNPDNETVMDFAANKAWCAAFLTQVLRDSGFDTDSLLSKDKFKQLRASTYAKSGTSVEINQAKAGDIMIKYHTKEEKIKYKAAFGHVGVVVRVDGDQVWFIGGNSGNQVKMASYNHKEKEIDIRRLKRASDIKTESVPALLDLKLNAQIVGSNLKNWFKQSDIAKLVGMDDTGS